MIFFSKTLNLKKKNFFVGRGEGEGAGGRGGGGA